jgi:hypothetical protein
VILAILAARLTVSSNSLVKQLFIPIVLRFCRTSFGTTEGTNGAIENSRYFIAYSKYIKKIRSLLKTQHFLVLQK